MSASNQIFKVGGYKIKTISLISDEIRLLDFHASSFDDFNTVWENPSTENKQIIKYDNIKSISNEEKNNKITIEKLDENKPIITEIGFLSIDETNRFLNFFQFEKNFTRTDNRLSPSEALVPDIWYLLFGVVATIFFYFQSAALNANPDVHSRTFKRTILKSILLALGPNGVLFIGVSFGLIIGYSLWKRYSNPPVISQLVP